MILIASSREVRKSCVIWEALNEKNKKFKQLQHRPFFQNITNDNKRKDIKKNWDCMRRDTVRHKLIDTHIKISESCSLILHHATCMYDRSFHRQACHFSSFYFPYLRNDTYFLLKHYLFKYRKMGELAQHEVTCTVLENQLMNTFP